MPYYFRFARGRFFALLHIVENSDTAFRLMLLQWLRSTRSLNPSRQNSRNAAIIFQLLCIKYLTKYQSVNVAERSRHMIGTAKFRSGTCWIIVKARLFLQSVQLCSPICHSSLKSARSVRRQPIRARSRICVFGWKSPDLEWQFQVTNDNVFVCSQFVHVYTVTNDNDGRCSVSLIRTEGGAERPSKNNLADFDVKSENDIILQIWERVHLFEATFNWMSIQFNHFADERSSIWHLIFM